MLKTIILIGLLAGCVALYVAVRFFKGAGGDTPLEDNDETMWI